MKKLVNSVPRSQVVSWNKVNASLEVMEELRGIGDGKGGKDFSRWKFTLGEERERGREFNLFQFLHATLFHPLYSNKSHVLCESVVVYHLWWTDVRI